MSKFSAKEESLFLVRLSFLLRSGAPLLSALKTLGGQIVSKKKVLIFEQTLGRIEQGNNMSKSFEGVVSGFTLRMIEIGELTGKLPEMLVYAGAELTKSRDLKKKIMSAFLYPGLVSVATLFLSVFLTAYIFPKILPLFSSVKMQLPLSTRILLFIYNLIHSYGVVIFISIGACGAVLFLLIKKNIKVKRFFHTVILHIPYAGRITQDYILATFCRILSLLLNAGITLPDAIGYLSKTIFHSAYSKSLDSTREHIVRGGQLSQGLTKTQTLFPKICTDMIAIGEEAGTLALVLDHLSELYENNLDTLTKNLPHILEPVLMIAMGTVVGFIAVSIISPIYQITQSIGH